MEMEQKLNSAVMNTCLKRKVIDFCHNINDIGHLTDSCRDRLFVFGDKLCYSVTCKIEA